MSRPVWCARGQAELLAAEALALHDSRALAAVEATGQHDESNECRGGVSDGSRNSRWKCQLPSKMFCRGREMGGETKGDWGAALHGGQHLFERHPWSSGYDVSLTR